MIDWYQWLLLGLLAGYTIGLLDATRTVKKILEKFGHEK